MIFETHAHYDDIAFNEDRENLLLSMQSNNVKKIVNIGSSLESCYRTIDLLNKYEFIYGAIGIHPSDVGVLTENDIEIINNMLLHEKVVAVGEIGLDYHYDEPSIEVQKKWFVRQIELARDNKLPMVIHSRDAAKDTIDILKENKAGEIGGVIHCYSYSKESAKDYLDMGFYFGIGGVLTFKNGKKLHEVVEYLPLNAIVLETDSPYLSPEPHRGSRNNSSNLQYVVKRLAEIKGKTEEEIEHITWDNACRLYNISE